MFFVKVMLGLIGWNQVVMKTNYSVYDSYGNLVKSGFPNWKSAYTYIISRQRYDWIIK